MKTRCFRRLLVLAALGALQHLANAQAYRPMVVEGNRWGEYFFFESSSAYVYEIKGDSTINGIAYKKVLTNGNSLNQCSVILREDTTERKVYYYNAGGQEKLLYDFSLLPGEIDSLECGSVIVQLDSISAFAPSGTMSFLANPRIYCLHRVGFGNDVVYWLEGAGSLSGLWYAASPLGFDGNRLLCHGDSMGVDDFRNNAWQFVEDSCYSVFHYEGIAEHRDPIGSISPNPASGWLHVSLRSGAEPTGAFELVGSDGRVVRVFRPGVRSEEIDLDISGHPAGLYLLRYEDQHGTRWEEKVIKE